IEQCPVVNTYVPLIKCANSTGHTHNTTEPSTVVQCICKCMYFTYGKLPLVMVRNGGLCSTAIQLVGLCFIHLANCALFARLNSTRHFIGIIIELDIFLNGWQ